LPSFLAFPHSLGIALSSIFLSRFKHSAHLISEPLGEKRVEHLEAITVGGGPRISSLVVFFGLGGWAYMGGRVPGNREKRTGGNREGRREKQGINQASNEIEEKGAGRRFFIINLWSIPGACARNSSRQAGRVGSLGSMAYHGDRGIEMNVCASFLVID
jgi:hypothetical protein